MTWVVQGGIQVWVGDSFDEPDDAELAEYGWSRAKPARPVGRQKHACLDCSTPIHHQSTRCVPCNAASIARRGGDKVDASVVERVLAGEWKLKTTRAEKEAVVARWLERRGTQNELQRLTGWHVSRYLPYVASRRAA